MKRHAFIFVGGLVCGYLLNAIFSAPSIASAQKPSQLDIIYKVAAQSFYLTQKAVAFHEYEAHVLEKIADESKIKPEIIQPLKNHLQQELFSLDLKIKELNH